MYFFLGFPAAVSETCIRVWRPTDVPKRLRKAEEHNVLGCFLSDLSVLIRFVCFFGGCTCFCTNPDLISGPTRKCHESEIKFLAETRQFPFWWHFVFFLSINTVGHREPDSLRGRRLLKVSRRDGSSPVLVYLQSPENYNILMLLSF